MSISNKQRQTLVDNLYWFHQHSSLFPYVQQRPFPIRTWNEIATLFKNNEQVTGYDCSGSGTEACYISGLKDPSGFNFNGLGNTETILAFLKGHYTNPAKALPGAFAIFNADLDQSVQHLAIVGDEGHGTSNPIMYSHGSAGFARLPLDELQPGFTGQTVFCSPGPLG